MVRSSLTASHIARLVAVRSLALQAPSARDEPVFVPGYPAVAGPVMPGDARDARAITGRRASRSRCAVPTTRAAQCRRVDDDRGAELNLRHARAVARSSFHRPTWRQRPQRARSIAADRGRRRPQLERRRYRFGTGAFDPVRRGAEPKLADPKQRSNGPTICRPWAALSMMRFAGATVGINAAPPFLTCYRVDNRRHWRQAAAQPAIRLVA